MITVTKQTHAWVYEKEDNPQRNIAALELLGDVSHDGIDGSTREAKP